MNKTSKSLAAAAIFAVFAGAGMAANITWTGAAGDGDWGNAANWSGAPSDGTFDPGDYRILFEKYTAAVPEVVFNSAAESSNENALDVRNSLDWPVTWSAAQDGFGLTWGADKKVSIGNTANGSGYLIVKSGTYSFPYGLWIASEGNYAQGRLDLEGGKISTATIYAGDRTGAKATLNLNGGELDATSLHVAYNTSTLGEATIAEGAKVVVEDLFSIGAGTSSTGMVTVAGGTVETKDLRLGKAASGGGAGETFAYLTVTDGSVAVTGNIEVGHNAGSTSTIRVDGGAMDVTGYLRQFGGGTTSIVEVVTGGNLTVGNYLGLGSTYGGNAKAELRMLGGEANVNYVSLGGTAKDSGGVENVATLSAGILATKYFSLGGKDYSGEDGTDYTVSNTIVFDGGTVKAAENRTGKNYFLPAESHTAFKVAEGGAVFDTAGYDIQVSAVLESGASEDGKTDGGLTKKGAGTLTFTAAPTFTGPVRLCGTGAIVMPEGFTYANGFIVGDGAAATYDSAAMTGSVTVEGTGVLAIDLTDKEDGTYDLPAVTFADGASAAANLVFNTGRATTETISEDGTQVTIAATETSVTTWIGGGADDLWETAANWNHGVPTEESTVRFTRDAKVTLSVDSGKGEYAMAKLVFENHPAVTFASVNAWTTRPAVAAGEIEGAVDWTLYRARIQPLKGATLTIPEEVTLYSTMENNSLHSGRSCSIEGRDDGHHVIVNGTIVGEPQGDYDFLGTWDIKWATVNGTMVFNSATNLAGVVGSDAAKQYGNYINHAVVNGNITGSGGVVLGEGARLFGDNNGFTGNFRTTGGTYADVFIGAATAGSSNAVWNVDSTICFYSNRVDNAVVGAFDGEVHFGTLNLSQQYQSRFYFSAEQNVTIVIGELGEDMTHTGGYGAGLDYWGSSGSLDGEKVKLVKRGAGKLTTDLWGIQKWVIEEGEVEFTPITLAQYEALSRNLRPATGHSLSNVTVKAGAALGGATRNGVTYSKYKDDGSIEYALDYNYTIGEVAFEDGAVYKTYLTEDETAAVGCVATDLAPAKLTCEGTLLVAVGQEGDMTKSFRVTALTLPAGATVGKAEMASGSTVASADGIYGWMAVVQGQTLYLRCLNVKAGFILRFR